MRTRRIWADLSFGITVVAGSALLVVLVLACFTALTALIVALIWNVLKLREVFNQPALTFWQVIAVALAINVLRSIFSGQVNTARSA